MKPIWVEKDIGTYLLMKENAPGVDPLSPANKLIFCTGPITNTRIYGSCRHGVFTKSPLTGIFSESYSGGKVAEPMSRTGYDAILFEEASKEPVWLEISDQKVVFHDAKDLWGKDTYFTEEEVIKRTNKKGAGALCLAGVLRELPKVRGFTFSHVEHHSPRAGHDPAGSARDRVVGYTPHVRVDLLLEDADVEPVLDALAVCPCGLSGRATYWVVPVGEHGRL